MSPFQKLALGGGGVKGILHIGALQELSKHQPLIFPEGVYGSSIGAVIGTYVAFGLPIDEKMYPEHPSKKSQKCFQQKVCLQCQYLKNRLPICFWKQDWIFVEKF
jgi:patatin-like phospholipase/acyl hydrolase